MDVIYHSYMLQNIKSRANPLEVETNLYFGTFFMKMAKHRSSEVNQFSYAYQVMNGKKKKILPFREIS